MTDYRSSVARAIGSAGAIVVALAILGADNVYGQQSPVASTDPSCLACHRSDMEVPEQRAGVESWVWQEVHDASEHRWLDDAVWAADFFANPQPLERSLPLHAYEVQTVCEVGSYATPDVFGSAAIIVRSSDVGAPGDDPLVRSRGDVTHLASYVDDINVAIETWCVPGVREGNTSYLATTRPLPNQEEWREFIPTRQSTFSRPLRDRTVWGRANFWGDLRGSPTDGALDWRYSTNSPLGSKGADSLLDLGVDALFEGDYVEALKWLLVGESWSADGNQIRRFKELRGNVAGVLSDDDVVEAERRAEEWNDAHQDNCLVSRTCG